MTRPWSSAIAASGRVFLETVLQREEFPEVDGTGPFERHAILEERFGGLAHVSGDWKQVDSFLGLKPPLLPYTLATHGYGHANFVQDDDQVYRRAALVTRASRLIEEIPLDQLTLETTVDTAGYERLSWRDIHNVEHDIDWPPGGSTTRAEEQAEALEKLRKSIATNAPPATEEDTDGDGTVDVVTYTVRRYRETLLPAITLSLAAEYLNVRLSDVEVVLGEHIRIPAPKQWNVGTDAWEPYSVVVKPAKVDQESGEIQSPEQRKVLDEILIPIDEGGRMLVNFMGYPSSSSFGSLLHLSRPVLLAVRRQSSRLRSRDLGRNPRHGEQDRHGGSLLAGHGRGPEAHAVRPDVRGGDPRQRPEHHPDG